jgi:hypothetical protein
MKIRRLVSTFLITLAIGTGVLVGRVSADQPHMQSALEHLRGAKHELERAEADKGGHRDRAMELTNDAIAQTEKGIEYARHH